MNTAVVTGGAGAIGSRLVSRLLVDSSTERVIVIDDLSSGHEWLLPKDSRVELIKKNVCDTAAFPKDLRNPIVFHLAAFFANQNSVDHPFDDLRTNGQGTLSVLTWAREVGAERVVYASAGCSIAGHGINAPIHEDMPVSLHLDTPYQITKALGEFYCNYFDKDVPTVRCRFFNSYGPNEIPGQYRNVIPNFIWRALHNEPLIITGTGNETRDFIWVGDLVEGLVLSATTPEARGQAFNLGTGRQTSVQQLVENILRVTHSKSSIQHVERRPWDHSLQRCADITRAKTVLNFRPEMKIEEGIEQTVKWFGENYDRIAKEPR